MVAGYLTASSHASGNKCGLNAPIPLLWLRRRSRMKVNPRRPIVATLTLLVAVLSGSPASADGYSVDFGVETEAGKDAGTLACRFGQTCDATLETLGLRVTILVFRSSPERVTVHLYGRDLSCCYFEYAADSMTIDRRKTLYRVPFFKGVRARGGLYIENERTGTLYLRFHFSGKPMPLWPTPPPIFNTRDNSNAASDQSWFTGLGGPLWDGKKSQASAIDTGAPAATLVPSDDSNFSGGLLGRMAALMGVDPRNPDQLAPPPRDDELRAFYRDPVRPWTLQCLR